MALTRDFMMRMIEKLSQAFFRILAGKSVDDPEQSILKIENLLSEALGTPREFVLGQGPAAIDTLAPSLAAEVGRLLMLHADLCTQVGDHERSKRARRMGLHALMRAMERPEPAFAEMTAEVLRDKIDVVAALGPAKDVAKACMLAHYVARSDERWDDAEDWLFWAIEIEPGELHVGAGREFYDFLETLDEDSLSEGGLSTPEIANARMELDDYL